jgi:hypothetical protein
MVMQSRKQQRVRQETPYCVGNAHIAVLPRAPTRALTMLELTPGTTHQPDDYDSSNSSRDLASLVSAASRSAREFLCVECGVNLQKNINDVGEVSTHRYFPPYW